MARKRIKVSRRMLFVWLMLVGFIFLFTPQNLTNKFQFAFARTFHWPLSISRTISLSARSRQVFANSNREYENHIHNLEKMLADANKKIECLSSLRQRDLWENAKFIIASVTRDGASGASGGIVINRGSVDGLAKGQYVLGDNSIIGTINEVSPYAAQVRLITDIGSKMAVEIPSCNITRMMQGRGNNTAKIPLLPKKYKVQKGDIVYAATNAGFLDTPIIVGSVSNCKKNDNTPLLWEITLKPACDLNNLSNVAVIVLSE
jgi:rod shape-determining protein MreC